VSERPAADIARAIERVGERIRAAALSAGRTPADVRLLAVSKRQSSVAIRAAYAAGQRDFGENYVQELLLKRAELSDLEDLRFHMIGHVQRNKVASLAGAVSAVHSVDSVALVKALGQRTRQRPVPERQRLRPGGELPVFIEVNLAAEPQKGGCSPEQLGALVDAVRAEPTLSLAGLMAIPSGAGEPEKSREQFEQLLALRERHGGARSLPELSLGMSRDLEVAVACGSSWVRVGTDIFGARL
jgi:PLP dependent protein